MKLLFICTHNRCRSIIAEAITNHLSNGHLIARSAGSQPAGAVHPLTLKHLAAAGIATDHLRSKSWDELETFSPDVVITVCDSAAGEVCPAWFGKAVKVHWGLPDPSRAQGSEADIQAAFESLMQRLQCRMQALLDLHPDALSPGQIITTFNTLGTL